MLEFSIQHFHLDSLVSRLVKLAGWLVGWLTSNRSCLLVHTNGVRRLCSSCTLIRLFFNFMRRTRYTCACVFVSLTKNDCLAYGIITEYRDNPSKDLPSAQWNCVCGRESWMKQQVCIQGANTVCALYRAGTVLYFKCFNFCGSNPARAD